MNTAPRLSRSFPFWLLLVGSLASLGYGVWLTIDKLTTMTSTLKDGSATGVEVYAGQSWAVFAAAFVGAGLVGLVVVLGLVVAASFVARPVAVVEAIDWTQEPAGDTAVTPVAPDTTAVPVASAAADEEKPSDEVAEAKPSDETATPAR
ncbi:hypothetical protein [Microbacterium sp. SORGH_AS_0888]|uniref:hypothetical protein n=1 Tax=Microbacterium sp. SORGH_AS_0888 TaxID=3041791 RepID=UPI00277E2ABE|nr:hypothetical protein [Microbacterium sp. SORGH_AS_0888]MDQ1128417.1 hypothetical protein [Microbacterium sp. SORGH_AS_0888]